MLISKPFLAASMILLLCALACAQDEPAATDAEKQEKQKEVDQRIVQMIEQSILDAATLRLPQNRAVIYAIAGDLYWKFDEKRSREIFKNAAAELTAYNLEVEKERRESSVPNVMQYVDFSTGPRGEILTLIAARDAELALELLLQTRPARLAEEMLKSGGPNARQSGTFNFDPERQRVRQEIALEQQFAIAAAEENPERAIKMIRQSMGQGVTSAVLPLLQKIHKKDPKKAAELAGEVVRKLTDSDLIRNEEDLRTSINFLQSASSLQSSVNKDSNAFSFPEPVIKELAGKVANTLLQPSRSMGISMVFAQAMPLLVKFVPERLAQLRQRQTDMQSELTVELAQMQRQQRLFDPNSTPEELLEQIPKLSNDMERSIAYQSLSNKIVQIDDDARARKLIDQIADDKVRANALEQVEARRINRSVSAGKIEEARGMIGNLTKKKTQIQNLVALAVGTHKKGGDDNLALAKELMAQARGLTGDQMETSEELGDMMEVVRGYSTVDPDIAFKLFEPVIDTFNEYIQASSYIAKFNSQTNTFRHGELTMRISGGDFPLFRYIPHMQALGKVDLQRMNTLVDRLHRSDARAIVKLYVLQGYLKDDKKPSVLPQSGGIGSTIIW